MQKIINSYEIILRGLRIEPILQVLDDMETCKMEKWLIYYLK